MLCLQIFYLNTTKIVLPIFGNTITKNINSITMGDSNSNTITVVIMQ